MDGVNIRVFNVSFVFCFYEAKNQVFCSKERACNDQLPSPPLDGCSVPIVVLFSLTPAVMYAGPFFCELPQYIG